MSREIDEKVVEMRFDNRDFEKNVSQSLSTLDKLKEKLNFRGAEKGFEDLGRAANGVNFGGMSSALDGLTVKFNALEAVAIGVLTKIASSAVDAGVQLVKSLSTDNIAAGWDKFGEKTRSVGTLISQGNDMDTVTRQLERLNWYTDETSYNFTDMVSNIAKFTASGKGLEESVTAMEGIANWAALSGQNASVASRAMYQLAQAMSAGTMRLVDWKSVQNLNMDTAEFRQMALDAAVALGTLQKNSDGTYESLIDNQGTFTISQFAEHLTEDKWFTSEVMMDVFGKYGSAIDQIYEYATEKGITASQAIEELNGQIDEFALKAFKAAQEARTWEDVLDSIKDAVSTGWMNTFEMIFGNYEEAKTLWTDLANELYDVFAEGGNVRNDVLKEWKNVLGGRDDIFYRLSSDRSVEQYSEAFFNQENVAGLPNELLRVQYAVGKSQGAFWNLYDALFRVNYVLDEFGDESEQAIGIVAIIKQAFTDIFPEVTAERFKAFTEGLREFTAGLVPTAEKAEKLRSTFKGLFAILDIGKQVVSAVWRTISPIFGQFGKFSDILLDNTADLGERIAAFAADLRENDTIYKTLQQGLSKIQELFSKVMVFIDPAIQKVKEWWRAAMDYLKVPEGSTVVTGIITIYNTLRDTVQTKMIPVLRTWWEAAKKYLHIPEKEKIQTWWSGFKTNVGNALTPAIAKLREWGRAFIDYMKNLDWEGIKEAFKGFGSSLREHFSGAIDICRKGLEKLRELLPDIGEKFKEFGSGVGEVFSNIWRFIKENILGENNEGLFNIAKGLIGLSAAEFLHSLSGPLKTLKEGISNLFGGFGEVLGSLSDTLDSYRRANYVEMIFKLAIGLGILAFGISQIAKQDPDAILAAGGAIATLMAELVGAVFVTGKAGNNLSLGTAINIFMIGMAFVQLAKALNIATNALMKIKDVDSDQMSNAVLAIVSIIATIGGSLALAKNVQHAKSIGLAFIEVALAMEIFADVIKRLSVLSEEDLLKGGGVIAGIMAMFGLVMRLMPTTELDKSIFGEKSIKSVKSARSGAVAVGLAFIEIAAALEIVADVIKRIGSMDMNVLLQGFIGMAAALAVLVIAVQAMPKGANVASIGLGLIEIALALEMMLGVIASFGAVLTGKNGLLVIAGGLLAVVGVFGALALGLKMLQPFTATLVTIAAGMLLAGAGMAAFGAGLLMVTTALAAFAAGGTLASLGFVGIVELIGLAIKTAVQTLLDMLPMIIEGVGEALVSLLDVVQNSGDKIFETLRVLIVSAIENLVEMTPQIGEMLLGLLEWALDWLIENGERLVNKIFDVVIMIIHVLGERTPELVKEIITFLVNLFSTVIDTLTEMDPEILEKAAEGMVALAGMMLVCAGISEIVIPALKGLAGAGAFVIELGAIIAAIGGLSKIPGATDLIADGGNTLQLIGESIGKFFGGIAGGTIKAFCDEISFLSPTVLEAAERAASIVLTLTGAAILDGLRNFLFGDQDFSVLVSFGESLAEMGPSLKTFATELEGVNLDIINTTLPILANLIEVANNLPRSGSTVMESLIGEKSLSRFGEELAALGPHLKEFGSYMSETNVQSIDDSLSVVSKLVELARSLPRSGSQVLKAWIGEKSLSNFGKELADLGPNLKQYGSDVYALQVEAITDSFECIAGLVEIANDLPSSGRSLFRALFGEQDIGEFGKTLENLGKNLKQYGSDVYALQVEAITDSFPCIQGLVDLAQSVPETGGIFQRLLGENSLAAFGTELEAFGPGLKAYGVAVDELDPDKVKDSVPAVQALVDIAKILSNDGTSDSLLGRAWNALKSAFSSDGTPTFGDMIASLGESLVVFYGDTSEVDFGKIATGIHYLKQLADILDEIATKDYSTEAFSSALKNIGQSMIMATISGVESKSDDLYRKINEILAEVATRADKDSTKFKAIGEKFCTELLKGIESKKNKINSDFAQFINAAINELKKKFNNFKDAGAYLADGLIKGFQSKSRDVSDQFTSVVSVAAGKMRDSYQDYYNVGSYLAEGLNNGIASKKQDVVATSREIGRVTPKEVSRVAEVQSPSKVMIRIGRFMGEGLVIGLRDRIPNVQKAGLALGKASLTSLVKAVNSMSTDIVEEDVQPVIRPVMDLSTLIEQKRAMSQMLNDETPSFNAVGLISASSSSAAMQNQNETATEAVVSEVRGLRVEVSDVAKKLLKLQVVMDSGQLVGAISDKVDTQIGKNKVRYQRGI